MNDSDPCLYCCFDRENIDKNVSSSRIYVTLIESPADPFKIFSILYLLILFTLLSFISIITSPIFNIELVSLKDAPPITAKPLLVLFVLMPSPTKGIC